MFKSSSTALTFWNAFELAMTMFMLVILAVILVREHVSFADLWKKTKKMMRLDFQGGPHDLLIALSVLYIGMFTRAEAMWEWQLLDLDAPTGRVGAGVLIKVIATFCLIRLLMPARNYNYIAVGLFLTSLVFATGSAFYDEIAAAAASLVD